MNIHYVYIVICKLCSMIVLACNYIPLAMWNSKYFHTLFINADWYILELGDIIDSFTIAILNCHCDHDINF